MPKDCRLLLVDINGSRELRTLLPLLNSYAAVSKPILMVVKNWRPAHVANSYELSSAVLANTVFKESAMVESCLTTKILQNEAQIKLLQAENASLTARRAALKTR